MVVHIVIFDEGASPEKVLTVHRRVNMGLWVDPTTALPLRSDVLAYADLAAVEGVVPFKYWKHDTGAIVSMTAAEITAQDAADAAAEAQRVLDDLAAIRAGAAAGLDGFAEVPLALRAFADVVREEINILRALHTLTPRTLSQLKTAITNKVNSGDVDDDA